LSYEYKPSKYRGEDVVPLKKLCSKCPYTVFLKVNDTEFSIFIFLSAGWGASLISRTSAY
jgi:hypothetical protein